MFKIEGLSPQDIALMDIMWNLDTEEDMFSWLKKQPPSVRKRATVLIELAVMADREEFEECENDLSVGQAMLKNIGVQFKQGV